MKTFTKTVIAAAIAMYISPVFAGEIQSGTTGYAAKVVNGHEEVIATTYKVGQLPLAAFVKADVKVVPSTNMPFEYQNLNQDSVGKVEFDVNKLKSLKKGQIAKLDFLGIPKDAKILDQVGHSNGDNTMVASTGAGDRTILTFGPNDAVIGSATVDGHNYSISTDETGSVWMVDNNTSGAIYKGLEHDTTNVVSLGYTAEVDKAIGIANTKIAYCQSIVALAETNLSKAQAVYSAAITKLNNTAKPSKLYDTNYVLFQNANTALNTATIALNSAKSQLAAELASKAALLAPLPPVTPPSSVFGYSPFGGKNIVNVLVYISRSINLGPTVVNSMESMTNQAYKDSGINMIVHVSRIVLVNDPAPTDETVALSSLASSVAAFGNVAADRVASEADLVTFIHPLKAAQGMCGLGNVNGVQGRPYSKTLVYSVVSYGYDGGYYCNNYTFAHELGHTMGMVHDIAHTPVGVTGHFVDSYGYGLQNLYGDIMSYFPVNGVFSTPTRYWKGDGRYPYGLLTKANTVRGLNAAAPEITMFNTLIK